MLLVVVPFMIRLHQGPHDFLRYTRFMLDYLLEKTGYRDVEIEEVGDIFDLHEIVLRDLMITLRKNADQRLGRAEAREVRKHVLGPLRKSVQREVEALRSRLGDDVAVLGEGSYPCGYGLVAYK